MLMSTKVAWSTLGAALLAASVAFADQTVDRVRPPSSDGPGALQQAPSNAFSAEERAEIERRVALARQIVDQIATEASALGLSDAWKATTMSGLFGMDSRSLAALQGRGYQATISSIQRKASRGAAPKVLGDVSQDLTYKPVTPCRLIDTRNTGGKINGTRSYDLDVVQNPYGGAATCNIETLIGQDEWQMGGFLFNVTIVEPVAAPGFAAVKPAGSASVTSLVNWYEAGPSVQIANAAIVTGAIGLINSFDIVTSSSVHVIVDFFGAFTRPQATALDCTDVQSAVTVVPNNVWTPVDAFCPAGYMATGGGYNTPEGTLGYPGLWSTSVPLTNGWRSWWDNQTGGNRSVFTWVRCCRVPGR